MGDIRDILNAPLQQAGTCSFICGYESIFVDLQWKKRIRRLEEVPKDEAEIQVDAPCGRQMFLAS
jgi:hypothetical protein